MTTPLRSTTLSEGTFYKLALFLQIRALSVKTKMKDVVHNMLRVCNAVAKQVPNLVRQISNPVKDPLKNQSLGEGYSLPTTTGKVVNALFFGVVITSIGIETGPKTEAAKAAQQEAFKAVPGSY
jgi:hypothetical protein